MARGRANIVNSTSIVLTNLLGNLRHCVSLANFENRYCGQHWQIDIPQYLTNVNLGLQNIFANWRWRYFRKLLLRTTFIYIHIWHILGEAGHPALAGGRNNNTREPGTSSNRPPYTVSDRGWKCDEPEIHISYILQSDMQNILLQIEQILIL